MSQASTKGIRPTSGEKQTGSLCTKLSSVLCGRVLFSTSVFFAPYRGCGCGARPESKALKQQMQCFKQRLPVAFGVIVDPRNVAWSTLGSRGRAAQHLWQSGVATHTDARSELQVKLADLSPLLECTR
ncbi:unnamed protein product [Pleuronectes platessa]|uniref:Uncharacterized protein n=1 Tax=Pleuronectes platessa TaxID=8262 RepID=A0A9N7TVP0_PLEPL|nr:unnamed protein product [Pleuronectes platessa]